MKKITPTIIKPISIESANPCPVVEVPKQKVIFIVSTTPISPKKTIFKLYVSFKKRTSKSIEAVPISNAGLKVKLNSTRVTCF